jgi:UDP-N-acetylglucosamine 4,6-dehydratase/5-epimerase
MTAAMSGRTVLITGGTGSFGSTMARHLLETDIAQIRILSRDEAKQDQMRHDLPDGRLRLYLGDVRDPASIAAPMAGVDYVFHAAALKQVPSCEFFPMEAVRTNVWGSNNVLEAAHQAGVEAIVCLSTDKAVYPINAMGMSKALMEKTAQAFARQHPESQLRVCVTRYGNVMYSRGSVIPLFVRQLRQEQPVTVTDPGMTRFMMSLADSVDLVEYAFEHGSTGDLLIRKAPGCTIETLVTALSRLFGAEPCIEVIGIRHGEKLAETLATREELARAQDTGKYFQIPLDERSLNYAPYFEQGEPDQAAPDDYTSTTTEQLDVEDIQNLLLDLPEIQRELRSAGRQ